MNHKDPWAKTQDGTRMVEKVRMDLWIQFGWWPPAQGSPEKKLFCDEGSDDDIHGDNQGGLITMMTRVRYTNNLNQVLEMMDSSTVSIMIKLYVYGQAHQMMMFVSGASNDNSDDNYDQMHQMIIMVLASCIKCLYSNINITIWCIKW